MFSADINFSDNNYNDEDNLEDKNEGIYIWTQYTKTTQKIFDDEFGRFSCIDC